MADETITIKGAREHNLRSVDLVLPKGRLIVFTGVSGSGKSSLAFDTLYAEGQRRYIESLSAYARQFLGQLKKPDVDHLSGLSPAISIEQKTGGANPRSTVATVTEIHDYLRVLFARIGRGHCPQCGELIAAQAPEQIVNLALARFADRSILILAPVVRNQKGEFKDFFADLIKKGYVRARVDGQVVRLADQLSLDRQMKHNIEVVVDRLTLRAADRPRLAEAIEQVLKLADGTVLIVEEATDRKGEELLLSAKYACANCQRGFNPPTPQLFSFNSPIGMCLTCDGLGESYTFDPQLVVPDGSLSVQEGAIALVGPFADVGRWRRHLFDGVADALGFSLDAPWKSLPESARKALLLGTGERHITFSWKTRQGLFKHGGQWPGVFPEAMSKYKKGGKIQRAMLEKYMRVQRCPACDGARLNEQARQVKIAGLTMPTLLELAVDELDRWLTDTLPPTLSAVELQIAGEVIKEVKARVGFLLNVGLHYLSLSRSANTLSGGEAQRIRLASQIGSGLVGVLYVLDEPSIGLHPRDNERLLHTLQQLRDQGNTVVVVEHDEETMRAADYIVDFGPGPGVRGGQIVAAGTFDELLTHPDSLTGAYLAGRQTIDVPKNRRPVTPIAPSPSTRKAGRKRVSKS